MKIDLFHNIRWARYKAQVFSQIHLLSKDSSERFSFFQIADTDGQRVGLSDVDVKLHNYPHELLFPGSYNANHWIKIAAKAMVLIFKSKADLVILPGYDRKEYWAMLLACVLTSKKRMVFCDSTLLDREQTPLKGVFKKFFFKLCDGCFTYGERGAQFLQFFGVSPSNIYQRYQAAALEDNYVLENVVHERVAANLRQRSVVFLYVGRLSEEKSLDVLISAFAKMQSTHLGSKLLLIGSGPAKEALIQQVRLLGLDLSVEFVGSMNAADLASYYYGATCLVLPSRSEPWGLVVNEALHHGCPVVVSENCGCVPELVVNGVTGYSFITDNVDSLVNALSRMVLDTRPVALQAQTCLDAIKPYSAKAAALQIIEACKVIDQK